MRRRIRAVLAWTAVILTLLLSLCGAVPAHAQASVGTKELAFVFLHGMGGNPGTLQGLDDSIQDNLPGYVADYGNTHPGVLVVPEDENLNRQYPNYVGLDAWAANVAASIEKYYRHNNLVLVGHSMGGKVALYLTAHNIGGLSDRIAAVVTVNSPIKHLADYYAVGGSNAWQVAAMIPDDEGVLDSLKEYDSSADGQWVAENKHWLAFVSAEPAPMSTDFDRNGVDLEPRDMDDGIVPISAQYSEGADVVYYGNHAHSAVGSDTAVADGIALTILDYLFGNQVIFSVPADSGMSSHRAGLLPGVYHWKEVTTEVPLTSGNFTVRNDAVFRWQTHEFVVGSARMDGRRSRFRVSARSLWVVSGVSRAAWVSGDEADGRLLLRVRVAPKTTVKVSWEITGYQAKAIARSRYEVTQTSGTPFTGITAVRWGDDEASDFRLEISSQAQGPVRWLSLTWRTFGQQIGSGYVIDQLAFSDSITTP